MMTPEIAQALIGHTPGPWEWDKWHSDLDPVWVMGMAQADGYINWISKCHVADARLIASAPDLLIAYLASVEENERLREALMEVAEMCNWATATAVSEYITNALKPKEPKP